MDYSHCGAGCDQTSSHDDTSTIFDVSSFACTFYEYNVGHLKFNFFARWPP